jgi:TonB family protein
LPIVKRRGIMGVVGTLTAALASGFLVASQEAALVAGQDVVPPKNTVYIEPVYPDAARRAGVQGLVVLEFVVDSKGEPGRIRVLRSIPPLDPAALESVKKWRYEPTLVHGVAREVILRVPVAFFQSETDMLSAYNDIAKRKMEAISTRLYAIDRVADLGAKRRKQVTKMLEGLSRDSDERIRSAADKALATLLAAAK